MWTAAFSIDILGHYSPYSRDIGGGGIAIGSDGNIWSFNTDEVFSMTPTGTIQGYPFPGCMISAIAEGSDGNIWFAESSCFALARITTAGTITSFPIVNHGCATAITSGPDQALWFACNGGNLVGRMDTKGSSATYLMPTPNSEPQAITTGADGNLWTWEAVGGNWVRVTTAGVVSEFPPRYPGKHFNGAAIVQGPNGSLYATSDQVNRIFKFNTKKLQAANPVVLPSNQIATGAAVGPDRDVWFTIGATGQPPHGYVAVIVTDPLTVQPTTLTLHVGDQQTITAKRSSGSQSKLKAVSLNSAIATVAANGIGVFVVTAVASGATQIKVSDSARNVVYVSLTVN